MSNIIAREDRYIAYAREIELRREIVAAMRLRSSWRMTAHRRLSSVRSADPRSGNMLSQPDGHNHAGGGEVPGAHTTRILLISDYDGLRYSRELLLRNEGYEVESMGSHDVARALGVAPFDIAVLCESIESDRVLDLSRVLRDRYPGHFLLPIGSPPSGVEPECDLRVDGFGGPSALLAALRAFIHGSVKSE